MVMDNGCSSFLLRSHLPRTHPSSPRTLRSSHRSSTAGLGSTSTSTLTAWLIGKISTDEITPGWVCYYYDETLGRYSLVGLRGGHIKPDAVKNGGFSVVVSGISKGCGSSREQALHRRGRGGDPAGHRQEHRKDLHRQNGAAPISGYLRARTSTSSRASSGAKPSPSKSSRGASTPSARASSSTGAYSLTTRPASQDRSRPPSSRPPRGR